MEKIGSNLRKLRELKNISQEFIANKLELSIKSYSNIENNVTKITLERLTQICEILEIHPQAMMNFDSEKIIQTLNNSHIVSSSDINIEMPEKERQQYEHRIKDLHKEIDFLRKALESGFKNGDTR
jgi:transcriptional regulator with XRE-family HTH domain